MALSCCIIAHNEGDRIERCIRAAQPIVDEIVVVDSGSTDDTVAKAKALGAKVFYNAWDGYGPQKRFAEDCATHDWILNLDADEVVTPELAREIAALMRSPVGPAARLSLPPGHGLSRTRQAKAVGRLPQLRAPVRSPARALPPKPCARHGRHQGLPRRAAQGRRPALFVAIAQSRARQAGELHRPAGEGIEEAALVRAGRACRSSIRFCSSATTSCGATAPEGSPACASRTRSHAHAGGGC